MLTDTPSNVLTSVGHAQQIFRDYLFWCENTGDRKGLMPSLLSDIWWIDWR